MPQDDAQAIAWYRKAAEQDCRRQVNLGIMYEQGEGVPADKVGIFWYRWPTPGRRSGTASKRDIAER
ncbi:MAG: hypothetical protein R3F36_01530 [Candidatus Competibacteraceae bacterium]